MEIDKQRNLHEDRMSDVRSFGSNYQRCSQSRKMSIGIAADLSANKSNFTGNRHNPKGQKGSPWISPKSAMRSRTLSESFNTAKNVVDTTAVGGACSNHPGVNRPTTGTSSRAGNAKQKKVADTTDVDGACSNLAGVNGRTTGTSSRAGNSKQKKVADTTAVDGACSNLAGVNGPTTGMSSQAGNAKQKKVDNVDPGKEGIKDVSHVTAERGKGSTQEAVEETSVRNEGVKQPKLVENRSKETLKLKLWEVLRTVPPVNTELDGSKSDDVNANVMMQKDGSKEDVSVQPRVNSDTIETDSENPEVAVSRPVTRSLSRKRGPAVADPMGLRKKLFHAHEENNVFTFDAKSYRAHFVATGKQLQSKRNSSGKKNLDIRTTKTSDPSLRKSNIQQVSSGSKRPSSADEISLRSGLGITRGIQDQGRLKEAVQREMSHSSPETTDSGQLGRGDNVILPGYEGMKDHFNCESAPKISNLINDIFSPANKVKTNVQLPKPSDQAKEIDSQNYTHMLAKRIIFVKDAFRFKSTLSAKQTNLGSHFRTELSDGPSESDDTVKSMKDKNDIELKHPGRREFDKTEEELSISDGEGSGEDMDTTPRGINCNEFSPLFRSPDVCGEHKYATPEAGHFEEQMPCQSKQVKVPPKFNYSELSPPFCFPKEVPTVEGSGDDSDTSPDVGRAEKHISSPGSQDIHETVNYNDLSPSFCSPNATRLTEASQEYQDGLERAVALFGCSLETFKDKLLSSTKKRSSEVLESTAEEIHSKFQSAKSQIEKDVAKLTSASRSKRQVLEKSFDEQQEQLRLIHEKFRDEIHRHLEDFTRTVNSLQAHENEMKGVIERRKASHQKLLLHVEEAVDNHLSDAQRRLISIQKAGRFKMLHLKTAIAECLEGGIFT